MTAPEVLPQEIQDELEVLVGPDAWAFHADMQSGKVDVVRAYRVRKDVRLVAADVLEAACAAARVTSTATAPKVKRFKVDGEYEEEYFASTDQSAAQSDAWCTKAARYRDEVASTPMSLVGFAPVMDEWSVGP